MRKSSRVDEALRILLDQNVPREIAVWLHTRRPRWTVTHATDAGLSRATDPQIFEWAQERRAVIVTFDEDFADRRSFPVGTHHGVIRLHVWPTTVEEAQRAVERLLEAAADEEIPGTLIIVDRHRIRIRRA